MAQPAEIAKSKSLETGFLSLLKVDNKGWNIALFDDTTKVSNCLCAKCGSVCCDAVELGCDHNDNDDVFLYCKQCLTELIKANDNKCMISSHVNPPLSVVRTTRRQIYKSMVICTFSRQYKLQNVIRKNDNVHVFNTNDEKEGSISLQPVNDEKTCEWKGTLGDLISKHISQCAKKNDPTFAFNINIKIKKLENENTRLKQEIVALKNQYNQQQRDVMSKIKELNDNDEENKKLREIIKGKEGAINMLKNKINEQSVMTTYLINVNDDKSKLIDSLKQQIEYTQQNEEKKTNQVLNSKYPLSSINLFKKDDDCIINLENSIITTRDVTERKSLYVILQKPWSKDTGRGIHELKLKCLQSSKHAVSIGMVTNLDAEIKSNPLWLFDNRACGASYQLYVDNESFGIYYFKSGKQEYQQMLATRKPLFPEWDSNSYAPNETILMRVDFNKLQLSFYINSNKIGGSVMVQPNTYYPAIAYEHSPKYDAIQIKVLSLD